MQTYGIPGHMIDIAKDKDFLAYPDPMPNVMKQLVTRNAQEVLIQYECEGKLDTAKDLHLPVFQHQKCTRFLFYCHSPDFASQIHKDNYECFLHNAWPDVRDDPTFFICIFHNVEEQFGFTWLSENTIVIRRPNSGLDFGAFADGLHFTNLDALEEKQPTSRVVLFMNDTVYGPTFPWWVQPRPKWTYVFESMLSQDVKLAGMTINTWYRNPHVQSMIMVSDHVGLRIGTQACVFARRLDKGKIINISEVGFSTAVLAAGFNIDCLAELLHGYDYRDKTNLPMQFNDVTYDNKYAGFSIHPFETVFSKTNRMHREFSKLLLHLPCDQSLIE